MSASERCTMSIEEIALEAEERMEKSVTLLDRPDARHPDRPGQRRVWSNRSASTTTARSTPLKQMANLSTPEPQQILIRPFDPSVDRRHRQGDPDERPGPVAQLRRQGGPPERPPLSVEQRKKLANRVKELAEEARVAIRNIRRDANKQADLEQTEKILTEDDVDNLQGRDPDADQEVRGQGQRDGRQEVGRDHGGLTTTLGLTAWPVIHL